MSAAEVNPYTLAMDSCLKKISKEEQKEATDAKSGHLLANMVQGRFVQYLSTRVSDDNDIVDPNLQKELTLKLLTLLGPAFFKPFRERIKDRPEIVFKLARMITYNEVVCADSEKRLERLFKVIIRKYFSYKNIGMVMQWIQSNVEIRKLVFMAELMKVVPDPKYHRMVANILLHDEEGIAPLVFQRYLNKNRRQRLISLITSGDWRLEAAFVQKQQEINLEECIEESA